MSTESTAGFDYSRNSLDHALSAYLRSHADNPVHWQEWNQSTLKYARENDLILLVSVGYSTCHWCHVMAADSFSDQECADYLNRHFMPIKVDREERPDIDQYMMQFLVATTGAGGWPLNAFLSADLKPFFAMTYAAPQPRFGRPGFLAILHRIKAFYDEKKGSLQDVPIQVSRRGGATADDDEQPTAIDSALCDRMDILAGGLDQEQKFPPHSSLLYALFRLADLTPYQRTNQSPDQMSGPGTNPGSAVGALETVARTTLDAMMTRGLHDHLQGGFYRYCVDRNWTIPHFEKMLYDQAMLLWNYCLAAARFANPAYEATAVGIIRCLDETFLKDGLLCAAHDADTDHEEGATYLWTRQEIEGLLTPGELAAFETAFELPEDGNFEGRIHLLQRAQDSETERYPSSTAVVRNAVLDSACRKLLAARRLREQPFTDEKKLTSWNCLAGIGLLTASRLLTDRITANRALEIALSLRETLVARHVDAEGTIIHGTIDGERLAGVFLEDHAALLLFLSYCYEEDRRYGDLIVRLLDSIAGFREPPGWIGANESDFIKVPADTFDSPTPSATALAEFALVRAAMVIGETYPQVSFGIPVAGDFQSVAALHARGYVFTMQSPSPVPWSELPQNAVQVAGSPEHHCFHGVCTPGRPVR